MPQRTDGQAALATLGARAQLSLKEKCKRNLFFLATEILGYDRLTEAFHKPILDRMDRLRRFRNSGDARAKDSLWLWPREHYKCLPEATRVTMDDGTMRAAGELREGEKIAALSDRWEPATSRVVATARSIQPCVRVHFRSGRSVTVSDNHPFRLVNRWGKAADLAKGDKIAVSTPLSASRPIGSDRARLIGYLIGDGGLTESVRFSCADDAVLNDFTRICEAMGFKVRKVPGENYDYDVTHGARAFVRSLGLLGLKSIAKHIPEEVMAATDVDARAFLAGWYDTDGSYAKARPAVLFCTSSPRLVADGISLLTRLGFSPAVDRASDCAWRIILRSRDEVRRFFREVPVVSAKRPRILMNQSVASTFLRRLPRECLGLLGMSPQARLLRRAGVRFGAVYEPTAAKLMRAMEIAPSHPYLRAMCALQWDEVRGTERALDQSVVAIEASPHPTLLVENLVTHNTSCRRAQVIQDYLWDPKTTIVWWHAVEEHAEDSAEAIGHLLQNNVNLRKVFPPGVLPAIGAKRFVGRHGFRLPCSDPSRAASFRAWGAGSEATGGHAEIGYLDDPVTGSDREPQQMHAKRHWYRVTVRNVVEKRGWLNASATRWDPEDLFQDWIESDYWEVEQRACLENEHGQPDMNGTPTLLAPHLVRKAREEMGEADFALQMQNDPAPPSEIPWEPVSCEHFIDYDAIKEGPHQNIVISDPAPSDQTYRRDGDKDFWATCVIMIRQRGAILEGENSTVPRKDFILIHGEHSQNWTLDVGIRKMYEMKKSFHARLHVFDQAGPSGPIYRERIASLGSEAKCSRAMVELEGQARGRNTLFGAFCELARAGRFLIASSVPDAFLSTFLYQVRRWRPGPDNKNGLRHDDVANAVIYIADPAVIRIAPRGGEGEFSRRHFGRTLNQGAGAYGGRHLRW